MSIGRSATSEINLPWPSSLALGAGDCTSVALSRLCESPACRSERASGQTEHTTDGQSEIWAVDSEVEKKAAFVMISGFRIALNSKNTS